jgi:signal transduction histidine kinase
MGVLSIALLIFSVTDPAHRGMSDPAILAAVAAYAAVPSRRRWPGPTLAATTAATAISMAVSGTHGWVLIAPLIALYHLAATAVDHRRVLVAAGLTVLALVATPTIFTAAAWLGPENVTVTVACGLALTAGDASRSRRAYIAEVVDRARQAEESREQEARRRVTEERLRIARDLHDSMGHHIALINAQAGMAEHLFNDQPATARQALGHIKQASRVALDDLRDTIGLLREPGEPADPADPTEPVAGMSGLGDLVASYRMAGMRVEQEVDGPVRPLSPAADLTAYRVVQESLTNVRKHAAGAPARVRLIFRPGALHIVVEDEGSDGNGRRPPRDDVGSPPVHSGTGHGIVGMRERLSAVGGSLDAGPRSGGGFQVRAVLPLTGDGRE